MSLKGGKGYYVAFYLLLLVMFVLLCVCVCVERDSHQRKTDLKLTH